MRCNAVPRDFALRSAGLNDSAQPHCVKAQVGAAAGTRHRVAFSLDTQQKDMAQPQANSPGNASASSRLLHPIQGPPGIAPACPSRPIPTRPAALPQQFSSSRAPSGASPRRISHPHPRAAAQQHRQLRARAPRSTRVSSPAVPRRRGTAPSNTPRQNRYVPVWPARPRGPSSRRCSWLASLSSGWGSARGTGAPAAASPARCCETEIVVQRRAFCWQAFWLNQLLKALPAAAPLFIERAATLITPLQELLPQPAPAAGQQPGGGIVTQNCCQSCWRWLSLLRQLPSGSGTLAKLA